MISVKVCAIILDYFGADKTETCLNSLFGQGLDTICIVDNSGDHKASANLHAAVNRVRATADCNIEIVTPGQNLGFAKGVNFALNRFVKNASPHDYFLLINNDA